MKSVRAFALLTIFLLVFILSGCTIIQNKFNDLMGFNEIEEELDAVKTGTATGIEPDEKVRDAVDLTEDKKTEERPEENEEGETLNTENDKQIEDDVGEILNTEGETEPVATAENDDSGSSGGLQSNIYGSSSIVPDNYSYEMYWGDGNGGYDDSGYCYKIRKNRVYKYGRYYVFSDDDYNEFMTLKSSKQMTAAKLGELLYYNGIDDNYIRAIRIMEDSSYHITGSATVNEFACSIYHKDNEDYVDEMGCQYTGGYEEYYISDDFGVVMREYLVGSSGISDGIEIPGGMGDTMYIYSFNTVTEADVTPSDGTEAIYFD